MAPTGERKGGVGREGEEQTAETKGRGRKGDKERGARQLRGHHAELRVALTCCAELPVGTTVTATAELAPVLRTAQHCEL